MNVGIIGAGALGLMAALKIARAGHAVEVLERDDSPGGLAVNFKIAGAPIERYYHHIFRSDTRIIALIDELGLTPKMRWGTPPTAVRTGDRTLRLDSPLNVLRFSPLSFPDRIRMGLVAAYLKLISDPERFEGETAAAWLKRWMGESVYRTVWEPQLRGKLGEFADEVSMPWFWARVHDRSMSLGYLEGGFGQLYERIASEIAGRGGNLKFGQKVERIRQAEVGASVTVNGEAKIYDQLLVTLPTSLFLTLAPDLPDSYRAAYSQVSPHLGALNVVLAIKKQLQWSYWLSIADPGYPFLVLVEHTNFLPKAQYGGNHVLYLGDYLPRDHRYFTMSNEELLDEWLPALKRINPEFDRDWVTEAVVNRAPFAQPIVTVGYRDKQPGFETPWINVWLSNMGQVYPHDRGQNYSLLLGEQVARRVLAAGRPSAALAHA